MKKLKLAIAIVSIVGMGVVAYGAKKEKEFQSKRDKKLHEEYVRRTINGPKPIPSCNLCGKPLRGAPCSNKTCPNFRKK